MGIYMSSIQFYPIQRILEDLLGFRRFWSLFGSLLRGIPQLALRDKGATLPSSFRGDLQTPIVVPTMR